MTNPTTDLLVTENDLTLDAGLPVTTSDSDAVAQDIMHMIREKGYVVQMIANRNAIDRAAMMLKIEIEMEKDARILPGTSTVTELSSGQILAEADTIYGEAIKLGVTTDG